MYDYYSRLPEDDKADAIEANRQAELDGTANPLPLIARQVSNRERDKARGMVVKGFLGAAGVLLAAAGFEIVLPVALAGAVLTAIGSGVWGVIEYKESLRAIARNQFSYLWTDEEYEEVADFTERFTPKTADAKASYTLLKAMCDEEAEDDEDEDTNTIDVPSRESSERLDLSTLLSLPLKERGQRILDQLKTDGCDLSRFVGSSLVATTGRQQSGKSTILTILSILEAAIDGKRIAYVTGDSDVYPVQFSALNADDQRNDYAGYQAFIDGLETLGKGSARDLILMADEMTYSVSQLGDKVCEKLWKKLLTGFIKSGAKARLIVHGDSADSMGIPKGSVGQAKAELKLIRAVRTDELEDFKGNGEYPSGDYFLQELADKYTFADSDTKFTIPDWLLTDTNEEGYPCAVRTILGFFPELDSRVQRKDIPPFEKAFGHKTGEGRSANQETTGDMNEQGYLERETSKVPGTDSTFSQSAAVLVKYLKEKKIGRTVSMTGALQAFTSSHRDKYKEYIEEICELAQILEPSQVIFKRNQYREWVISYQE